MTKVVETMNSIKIIKIKQHKNMVKKIPLIVSTMKNPQNYVLVYQFDDEFKKKRKKLGILIHVSLSF
jgi:hypothetical protein